MKHEQCHAQVEVSLTTMKHEQYHAQVWNTQSLIQNHVTWTVSFTTMKQEQSHSQPCDMNSLMYIFKTCSLHSHERWTVSCTGIKHAKSHWQPWKMNSLMHSLETCTVLKQLWSTPSHAQTLDMHCLMHSFEILTVSFTVLKHTRYWNRDSLMHILETCTTLKHAQSRTDLKLISNKSELSDCTCVLAQRWRYQHKGRLTYLPLLQHY